MQHQRRGPRRVEFEDAIAYRLMGDCRVTLGPGTGFSGARTPHGKTGDPRSSYRKARDQVARLRTVACAVLEAARHPDPAVLTDALELLDAEISRVDAENARLR